MRRAIATSAAPSTAGPYSQAIRAGNFVFVAGQIPVDPHTGAFVEGDVGAQTAQVLQNLGAILESAGASYASVVRTTVFLTDIGDLPAVNEVYASFFPAPAPARTTVQAARLPANVQIEIDAIALVTEPDESAEG